MKRALAVAMLAGCAGQLDAPTAAAVSGREDLTVFSYRAHVAGGLSDQLAVELGDDVTSALIEIEGARGQFRLAQLQTPLGRDVVESGGFVTRDAREVDGLVDWLYPNSPAMDIEGGRHVLRFTALGAGGRVVEDEDVTVRLYTRTTDAAGGALKVDFLVADDAVEGTVDALGDALAADLARLYAQAGMRLADYTVATLHAGDSELPLDGGRPSPKSLATLQAAMRAAGARPDAVHLVIVRALDDGNGPVAGYALGLPGPFDPARPTAAVLVGASPFASPTTGVIDSAAMAVTCAHEIGHYLGLYHTSERDGRQHDPIGDTDECGPDGITCPDGGNIMFWTGGGARSRLTTGQGTVMRRHPLVAASAPPAVPLAECHDACAPPETCVVLGGRSTCATACDPESAPCSFGACGPSDDGTFVCRD
jgi:hypothetical protein